MNAEKELRNLDIFIKGIKTDKVTLIDTIPIAYKLARAVDEAKACAYEQTKEVEDLVERFLRKLDNIVREANLLEGTSVERKKGRVSRSG